MTKDEIKDLFRLDELVNILKVMDNYKDAVSVNMRELSVNDKVYDVLRNGRSIIIKEHNNSNGIGMSYTLKAPESDYVFYNSCDLSDCRLIIDYRFQNGHILKLEGNVSVVGDSLKNMTSYDLMNSLKINYIINRNNQTPFTWDLEPGNLKKTPNGYNLNGFEISDETAEIISINGEEIPSLETIQSYIDETDPEKKLNSEVFEKILSLQKIDENTTMKDAIDYLERKEEYLSGKFLSDYVSVLERVKALTDARDSLIEDLNSTISREDLDLVGDIVEDEVRTVYADVKGAPTLFKTIGQRLGNN